jgi:chorismate--pyruvate lyase
MAAPHLDEVAPLGLYPGHLALVREVLLKNAGTPLVFAHSVIPPDGLKGPWAGLAGLGNRPWAPPCSAIRASPATPWNTSGWTGAIRSIATRPGHVDAPPRALWARRSLFSLENHPILVTEVFLPALLEPR